MEQFKLKSWDGKELFCTLWETENPKAVIQLSHGMSEYGGRYDAFARLLNSRGYIVFADDHRAHGRTESTAKRGHDKGFIFGNTVKDLVFIHNYLKEKYNLPQVLIGHSYGSFLAQAFYLEDTDAKGVALLGTGYMPGVLTAAAAVLLAPFQLVCRSCRPKIFIKSTDLLFRYKGDNGPSQWVTSDKVSRKAFLEDPYCGTHMSINFVYSMIKGIGRANRGITKADPERKLGIFCGADDPIGAKGRGARALYNRYKKYGIKDVVCKIYDGARHEVHNEVMSELFYTDILEFIERCIAE